LTLSSLIILWDGDGRRRNDKVWVVRYARAQIFVRRWSNVKQDGWMEGWRDGGTEGRKEEGRRIISSPKERFDKRGRGLWKGNMKEDQGPRTEDEEKGGRRTQNKKRTPSSYLESILASSPSTPKTACGVLASKT
jgi:hypothetical protein